MDEARSEIDVAPRRTEAPVETPPLAALGEEAPPFEPNRLLRWLYGRFFRHMRVDERWSGAVREAAARGIVVYVMRSISVLDFLCLDYLVKRFRLPLVRFVNDLGLWILEPFGRGERRLRLRRQIPQPDALTRVVHEQQSALLFLRRPPSFGRRRAEKDDVDLIRTIVEQQRKTDRPILLVPQTFVWTKRPPRKWPTLLDILFGPSDWPGRLRVALRFFFNYRNAHLRSGPPFDVAAFLKEHQDLTDAQAADRIRYALLRRIEREREIVLGPAQKSAARIREELLRSPRLRRHIEAAAREKNKPVAAIEKEADRELKRMCAMMDPTVIGLFFRFLDWLWTRIYDGLVIDQEGLERLREAARHGPLVLLPSHKSHIDYLVLSYVLGLNAVNPPLIAAGENLSFFPVGSLLRRSGAFFIKRSFRGSKLYPAMVDAYLRKILVEGWNVEFFLEGGRSRTGKLLPPKLGLLSMVLDAGLRLPSTKLSFVPISIGYERIIEEGSYAREQEGGEKSPESVGGLLRTSKVLRSRYGRLYIQFGEIFSLDELLEEAAAARGAPSPARELKPAERRALIQRIAHRVSYEINRVTMVTPAALVATALLTHRRRGIRESSLVSRCAELVEALLRLGAPVAPTVVRDETSIVRGGGGEELLRADAVHETLRLFDDGKLVESADGEGEPVYRVPHFKRLALEYYKNTILHFFVPSALIAAALSVRRGDSVRREALRESVRNLSRLFKYEFMYRADAGFDAIFDDALSAMIAAGEVVESPEGLREVRGSLVAVYASMLRTYFESYYLAVRSLRSLGRKGSVKRKDWLSSVLARGHEEFLAGEIQLRESLARPKLENALSALHDHGLIRLGADKIEAGAALADDEALGAFERRLEKYLD
ncbi:MAG: 1-acyl-sn-glycerol-3-phosphate acyltransferase [Sandaracinaceae bacterium]|nr:1-acyl-sn-glycerol-3-phosphate acyltransferase [Sandaracinaceae bacterium]